MLEQSTSAQRKGAEGGAAKCWQKVRRSYGDLEGIPVINRICKILIKGKTPKRREITTVYERSFIFTKNRDKRLTKAHFSLNFSTKREVNSAHQ
jgi:hypothetical protein